SAALCALGPGFKFETPVYRRGPLSDGRLDGDLILVASGDLTLGGRTDKDGRLAFKDHDHTYANANNKAALTDTDPLAGLKSLARQVKQAGVRAAPGGGPTTARLFDQAQGSGSGPDVVTPVLVNDNVIDVLITPGAKAGDPATVRTRPETSFFQVDARVETVSRGRRTRTIIR